MFFKIKKILYVSIWKDVGVLQGELKIKHRDDKWKSVVTLEWLIQYECVCYLVTQDTWYDLAS